MTVAAVAGFALGVVLLASGALKLAAGPRWTAQAAAMLVVFTVVLVVRLAEGRRVPCACFGARSARPIGVGSVVRNLVLIALALVAAFS